MIFVSRQLTEAGHRVLQLLEQEWMTDETHVLSQSGDRFTVRGFHGDYDVRVYYQGDEIGGLQSVFTLGTQPHTLSLDIG